MKKNYFFTLFLTVISFAMVAQTTHNLDWANDGTDANQQITIEVGDTVIWTWGSGTHNLRATAGTESFDSGYSTGAGNTFQFIFDQVGSTDYVCDPHAGNMYGTVTVTAAQATEPTEAAPTPPAREAGDVVSIFSDAYTDVTLTELPTSWSDVTTFEATTVASDNVWKLSGLEFLGMVTNYDTGIDVSTMEMLHIDYWVPTGVENELLIKIVNTIDGGEDIESLGTTVSGSWQSIDIDMTGFVGNLANTEKITQILIDAVERADTVFIDNFYFYKEPVVVTEPTEAAPTPPAREAGDVVSIFSDAYTDVTLTELPTSWSDVTTFEATTVASDNVWKLSGLEFLGMVTNYDTGIDVSTMEMLHIDYWVPTGVENELLIKIVNTIDGGEDIESLGTTVSGSWQSIDIDMTGFVGNLANTEKITQILIDAVNRADTVFVDNFYFYKAPTSSADVVFITELADPNDNAGARYVEIYNGGSSSVDLTGWTLRRYTNGNSEPQTSGEDLTPIGTLAPGAIAIIAANGESFAAAFGMEADISAGTGGPADSNGDDQIYITDASDAIVDFFGVPGEDGSGTDHEFEDGRAERKASVTQGTATWDVNEWNIDNDGGAGDGAVNVGDDVFDPGVWIGEGTAGLDDQDLSTLSMYPNPATNFLNISAQNTINSVEIFNILGQKVISMSVEDTSASINISNLNTGIYLIKYVINNRTSTKKFVKN